MASDVLPISRPVTGFADPGPAPRDPRIADAVADAVLGRLRPHGPASPDLTGRIMHAVAARPRPVARGSLPALVVPVVASTALAALVLMLAAAIDARAYAACAGAMVVGGMVAAVGAGPLRRAERWLTRGGPPTVGEIRLARWLALGVAAIAAIALAVGAP